MIEFLEEGAREVVGIRATGTLTNADYKDHLIPRLETRFREFGKLRVLFYMDEQFIGWDIAAAWDDAALAFKHRLDFERIAVVGGPEWVAWCIKCTAFLVPAEIRIFPREKLKDAWHWIKSV